MENRMNTENPAVELVTEQNRSPMANPFEAGPNFDPARAHQLVQSDPELAAHFRDMADGGQDR